MAPVIGALRRRLPDARHAIVHTGQHYDRLMSEIFLEELGVPAPDHMLGVGSGSHAEQAARVIERLEPVLLEEGFRARGAAAELGLEQGDYLLVTLHRPALVDGPLLEEAMSALAAVAAELPVVFPVHPRTRKRLAELGWSGEEEDIHLSE